jgi:hypothetical protein
LTHYTSSEINKIKGLKTTEVKGKLGYTHGDEIIHRDDLVCPGFQEAIPPMNPSGLDGLVGSDVDKISEDKVPWRGKEKG